MWWTKLLVVVLSCKFQMEHPNLQVPHILLCSRHCEKMQTASHFPSFESFTNRRIEIGIQAFAGNHNLNCVRRWKLCVQCFGIFAMFCTMFVRITFLGLPFKNPRGSQNLDPVFDQISTLSQARPATHSAIFNLAICKSGSFFRLASKTGVLSYTVRPIQGSFSSKNLWCKSKCWKFLG